MYLWGTSFLFNYRSALTLNLIPYNHLIFNLIESSLLLNINTISYHDYVAARQVNGNLFTETQEKQRSIQTDEMKRDVERKSWSVVGS